MYPNTVDTKKTLVCAILDHACDYEWTLQGFGMLRLYLDRQKVTRLHVWDSRFAVPGVSTMHTHPWNFVSLVVAGKMGNVLFRPNPCGTPYQWQRIKCGEGGGLVGAPALVHMWQYQQNIYTEKSWYEQKADEVHVSHPQDGTVTLVEREFLEDADHAVVYWPDGTEWVSAEPRPATEAEVREICGTALQKWF